MLCICPHPSYSVFFFVFFSPSFFSPFLWCRKNILTWRDRKCSTCLLSLVFVQHCPLRLLIANSVLHFRKFVEWKGSRFVNVFWGTIISPSGLFRWPFNLVSGLLLLKTHILSWHLFLLFLKLFGSCKSNILSLLCSHHSAQAGQLHEDFMALSPQRTFSLEC